MSTGAAPRVLIVDDHAGFRSSARLLLESEGFHVVGEADSGGRGLTAARELHPDVVLLDVYLPDTDGFALAERLVSGEHPPVVVLTSASADLGCLADPSAARGFIAKQALSGPAIQRLVDG